MDSYRDILHINFFVLPAVFFQQSFFREVQQSFEHFKRVFDKLLISTLCNRSLLFKAW